MMQFSPLLWVACMGAIVAALGGAAAGWALRDNIADREIAEMREAQAAAVARATEKAREIEQTRVTKLEKIADDATKQAAQARRDAAAADAVAVRLRDHVRKLASRSQAPSDPAVADSSAPIAGPGLLLADLFTGVDEAAGRYARLADEARAAGLACEKAYDALRQ